MGKLRTSFNPTPKSCDDEQNEWNVDERKTPNTVVTSKNIKELIIYKSRTNIAFDVHYAFTFMY